jgi:signal transduction histidine kinase
MAIALVGAASIGCLAIPIATGGQPAIFLPIFICFSASYVVAGAIGWTLRPSNPVGPLLLAIGLAGAFILLGATGLPWIGIVTQASATTATILLFLILLISPTGHFSSRLDRFGFAGLSAAYVLIVVVRPAFLEGRQPLTLAIVSAALLFLVARRWALASRPARRSLAPVAMVGVITSAVFLMNSISIGLGIPNEPGSLVFAIDAVGRALIPFGFVLALLRLRMARIAVSDLVTEWGEMPSPARLRDALVSALGDPTLQLGYWSASEGQYRAADGSVVAVTPVNTHQAVTHLEHHGDPIAVITHDAALAEDPGLVTAVGAAVRLAVENERLTAEVESQLEEVRASRRRILAAGDAERKRVERDLHDGAQQRLVSVSLALRLAQLRLGDHADPAVQEAIEQASEDAKAALQELRELARGIHPTILTDAGLAAAVQSLADRSAVPAAVDVEGNERYATPVEGTAYYVVSEALANVNKYARAEHASVRIERTLGALLVVVSDDGIGDADPSRGSGLSGLIDRLAAVNGTLEIDSPSGLGTRVTARIPISAGAPIPG